MGLDMYLYKTHYIGNKWKDVDQQLKLGLDFIKDERISEITELVGQWRKANAIHAWFVENVQDGKDDCKRYYVSEENLQELLKTVTKVLDSSELVEGTINDGYSLKDGKTIPNVVKGRVIKNPKTAKKLLPTQSGFFFGGTDYDEYYYEDLQYTKKLITELLKEAGAGDYYYQSSW